MCWSLLILYAACLLLLCLIRLRLTIRPKWGTKFFIVYYLIGVCIGMNQTKLHQIYGLVRFIDPLTSIRFISGSEPVFNMNWFAFQPKYWENLKLRSQHVSCWFSLIWQHTPTLMSSYRSTFTKRAFPNNLFETSFCKEEENVMLPIPNRDFVTDDFAVQICQSDYVNAIPNLNPNRFHSQYLVEFSFFSHVLDLNVKIGEKNNRNWKRRKGNWRWDRQRTPFLDFF